MDLTAAEQAQLQIIRDRFSLLRVFLDQHSTPDVGSAFLDWHKHLLRVKEIVGNSSNNDSFVACLMAKEYLYQKLPMRPFDVGAKAQGAPGLDIDAMTIDGKRVIGEVKTTIPYMNNDLGSQQKTTFKKDFDKLSRNNADHKYLFVTNTTVFQLMTHKYASNLRSITVVLLTTGQECAIPAVV